MRWKPSVVGFVLLAVVAAGCGDDGANEARGDKKPAANSNATVSITKPQAGARVKGNVVTLQLEAKGIEIKKAEPKQGGGDDAEKPAAGPKYHVYVDKDPVPPGQRPTDDVIQSTSPRVSVHGLSLGEHTITAVLAGADRKRLGSSEAKVTVTVEGPSVVATAPEKIAPDQPFNLEVKVDGVRLVNADRAKSTETGHLHVFIDKQPTKKDQPIPTNDPKIIHTAATSVPIPKLAAGTHTLWVVLGDGLHVPVKPSVMDRVVVRIGDPEPREEQDE